ncbi:MAG: protein kinase, partial [Holophagales bacterium]|nr:protein kinase [Holophagales bacterium]
REPEDLAKKIDFLAQIASGLEYAHAQGVIHRDIKPGNVRVLDSGQVKIMDFGTAKLAHVESHLTQAGMTLGTVAYLSPERLLGQPTGINSDIFSYGVLAYELFSFRRPFGGRNIPNLIDQVLNAAPVPLADSWPGCPEALAEVVHRCLQKDPGVRYATCTEILSELETIMLEVVGSPAPQGFFNEASTTVPVAQANLQVSGLLERARQLIGRGRHERAAFMLEEVLDMAPANEEARQLLATCRAAAGAEDRPESAEETPSTSGFVWEGPEERKARKRGEAVASIERYIESGQLVEAVEALRFANQLVGTIEDAPGLRRRALAKAREKLSRVKAEALEASRFVVDQMILLRQRQQLSPELARRFAGLAAELDPDELAARDLLEIVESEHEVGEGSGDVTASVT